MSAVKEVSLREANQGFARLIREVETGQEVVITRHGAPVARLLPVRSTKRALTPEQEAAWERIQQQMREHPIDLGGRKFSRDELYDEMIGE